MVGCSILPVGLENSLEQIFSRALDEQKPTRGPFKDAEIRRIAQVLENAGKRKWARIARTFTILHMLGIPGAIEDFLARDCRDIALPYTEDNLPDFVKGGKLRRRFLQVQQLVLRQDVADLEISGKPHRSFAQKVDDHFESIQELGSGGFGVVDHVRSKLGQYDYARKRMSRGHSFDKDKKTIIDFENELKILKLLSHMHLVKVVGSYTDIEHVGFIMSPVADSNLEVFIASTANITHRNICLKRFFGCLGTALKYLHDHNVKHKDIKPTNILVKGTTPYLADFGTSKNWKDGAQGTTEGPITAFTPRYCAPEVGLREPTRNNSVDIFSLGCVFLEILTLLQGRSLDDLKHFYISNGENLQNFYSNPKATSLWFTELKLNHRSLDDTKVLVFVEQMMQPIPRNRPTATNLANFIHSLNNKFEFCGLCCLEGVKAESPIVEDSGTVLGSLNPPEGNILSPSSLSDSSMINPRSNYQPPSVTDATSELTVTPSRDSLENTLTVTPSTHGSKISSSCGNKSADNDERQQISGDLPSPPCQQLKDPGAGPIFRGGQYSYCPPKSSAVTVLARNKQGQQSAGLMHKLLKDGSHTTQQRSRQSDTKQVRFGLIPPDRRPKPTSPKESNITENEENWTYTEPIPLSYPSITVSAPPEWPHASRAPSYILAGHNTFSNKEIDQLLSTRHSQLLRQPSPLFVYGSWMFPSILSAQAARTLKGYYDPDLQRRVIPTTNDWNGVDRSIQNAAEAMTPAELVGWDRWQPSKLTCAAIQQSRETDYILNGLPTSTALLKKKRCAMLTGKVQGCLIFGLGSDTLNACSSLMKIRRSNGRTTIMNLGESSDRSYSKSMYELREVKVQIRSSDGTKRSLTANTFVWACGAKGLSETWDIERFINSNSFAAWSDRKGWVREETQLARTMRISYIWPGDPLSNAVSTGRVGRVYDLIVERGYDVNAPCHKFGTVLKAAVIQGQGKMVRLLLSEGAQVNDEGGEYHTALLAATMCRDADIVDQLLQAGADPLSKAGKYISPLYQAVSFSNYDIVELLLERGAWLTKDYAEILDLAAERNKSSIINLLIYYDARKVYKVMPSISGLEKATLEAERRDRKATLEAERRNKTAEQKNKALTSSPNVSKILEKALYLSTQRGSWRGIKGVEFLQTAIAAGCSSSIVDKLADSMKIIMGFNKMINIIKSGETKSDKDSVVWNAWRSDSDDESSDSSKD